MKLKQTAFDFDFETTDQAGNAKPHEPAHNAEPVNRVEEPEQEILSVDETIEALKKGNAGRKKIASFSSDVSSVVLPEDEELFSKSYYPMSAVSEMFNVKPSVLRFWELEFKEVQPKKNNKGDRLFRPEDIKILKLIHDLLRVRKFTIEGARAFLKRSKHAEKKFEVIESLKDLKAFLYELKVNL